MRKDIIEINCENCVSKHILAKLLQYHLLHFYVTAMISLEL